jgi:hypothetical protein
MAEIAHYATSRWRLLDDAAQTRRLLCAIRDVRDKIRSSRNRTCINDLGNSF